MQPDPIRVQRRAVVTLSARRGRVTEKAVREVLQQLGPDLSIRDIREVLGGGSLRDVARMVALVKDSAGGRADAALAHGRPPADVLAAAIHEFENRLNDAFDKNAKAIAEIAKTRQPRSGSTVRDAAVTKPIDEDRLRAILSEMLVEALSSTSTANQPASAVVDTAADTQALESIRGKLDQVGVQIAQSHRDVLAATAALQQELTARLAAIEQLISGRAEASTKPRQKRKPMQVRRRPSKTSKRKSTAPTGRKRKARRPASKKSNAAARRPARKKVRAPMRRRSPAFAPRRKPAARRQRPLSVKRNTLQRKPARQPARPPSPRRKTRRTQRRNGRR